MRRKERVGKEEERCFETEKIISLLQIREIATS
jgi:hypothetical protein